MPAGFVAVIGGGPAGLMAAEVLANAGQQVKVYDAMPSVGRKFLLAGRGGLNLTHNEPAPVFRTRFAEREHQVSAWLDQLDAEGLRQWAHDLGIDTFVGTSGRVFPAEMKAAPLLRAWLRRLRASGVEFFTRHRWQGWDDDGALLFTISAGQATVRPVAVVLALGGASWPRLGSDGSWLPVLAQRGVKVEPLLPSNSGFLVNWSAHFSARFAGQPLKSIAMAPAGTQALRRGECIVSADGLEGGLVYAWSAPLRQAVLQHGSAQVLIDLLPGQSLQQVQEAVSRPRQGRSWSTHLARLPGLRGVKMALLRECLPKTAFDDPLILAEGIKRLPVTLQGLRPLDEAISTAGGVSFEALDPALMLHQLPGVFCAGEMLDWEAPTGGYLLTACFASGKVAAQGVLNWLSGTAHSRA